jgi:hypothetical protein
LRKILIAALAAFTALAVTAVAIAQTTQKATLSVSVSPKKAGTKKKPASTKLSFKVVNGNPNATLSSLTINQPKTLKINAKGFPKCGEQNVIDDKCPKASFIGNGTASAILGVNNPPATQTPLTFKIRAFVTGPKSLAFRLDANEIDIVVVSPGKISSNGRKLTIEVPDAAQQPAPGVFAGLQDINTVLGGKYKKNKLITATGCTKGQHQLSTKLFFRNNGTDPGGTATASDGAPCKKK